MKLLELLLAYLIKVQIKIMQIMFGIISFIVFVHCLMLNTNTTN